MTPHGECGSAEARTSGEWADKRSRHTDAGKPGNRAFVDWLTCCRARSDFVADGISGLRRGYGRVEASACVDATNAQRRAGLTGLSEERRAISR